MFHDCQKFTNILTQRTATNCTAEAHIYRGRNTPVGKHYIVMKEEKVENMIYHMWCVVTALAVSMKIFERNIYLNRFNLQFFFTPLIKNLAI